MNPGEDWQHVRGVQRLRDGRHAGIRRAATNPEFIEWLMGLPAGWVTEVPGLTRNQQIKALGNGVVPQCAAAALRQLLDN